MRKGSWSMKPYVLAVFIIVLSAFPALPDGFRNITSIIFSYYFDETYRLDSQDVLLIRLVPRFTLKTGYARVDAPARSSNTFSLGPVINFTKTFYMDAVYGFGFDSGGDLSHMFDANLTQEAETLVVSFGTRGVFFPSPDDYYYYFLPSISGAIYPVDQVRLFCKLFFSWDSEDVISGSVWGEIAYTFTSLFTVHTGFTLSYNEGLGYSGIVGCKLTFHENFSVKYFFQYLDNILKYYDVPDKKTGIVNGIIVDWRF